MKDVDSVLPKALFVGGTDTGVGKTLICGCLLSFLQKKGTLTGYQKWVSTGSSTTSEDAAFCRKLAPGAFLADHTLHVPYRFSLPASPHLAAEAAGESVQQERIIQAFAALHPLFQTLVVEGVGGLLVPLSRQLLLVDLVEELKLPILLVCRSGLGSINHSLLSIEACRKRKISLIGLVFSDEAAQLDERIVADNMRVIGEISGAQILGRLPHARTVEEAVHQFSPIGEAILHELQKGK